MNRRAFLISSVCGTTMLAGRVAADMTFPIFNSIRLIVVDALINSDPMELGQGISSSDLVSRIAAYLQTSLQSAGSQVVVVARSKFADLDANYPLMFEMYATARVELGYIDSAQSSIVGAVCFLLARDSFSNQLAPAPWTFFMSTGDPSAIAAAVTKASLTQTEKSLAAPFRNLTR